VLYCAGPWHVSGRFIYGRKDRAIARILLFGNADVHNARLIAAAPEMLDALELALETIQGLVEDLCTEPDSASARAIESIETAIIKAKGRETSFEAV